jgi:hypothetical protein
MALSELRGRLIRLAHTSPSHRATLAPVLREIAASLEKEALRKRNLQKMLERGGTFGIISAYQGGSSKKKNQERHGELMADLQRLGYRPVPLRGSWEGVTEKSMLIPDIRPEHLFELGRKYGQDAVIHKSKDGVLGMYHTKGEPKAQIAVDPKADPAFAISTNKDLYSKARGLSFEFGFLWGDDVPWDGHRPVSRKDMRKFVREKFPTEKREKKTRDEFEKTVEGKRYPHPDTGNKVLYVSLPSSEQTKLYQEWQAEAA